MAVVVGVGVVAMEGVGTGTGRYACARLQGRVRRM